MGDVCKKKLADTCIACEHRLVIARSNRYDQDAGGSRGEVDPEWTLDILDADHSNAARARIFRGLSRSMRKRMRLDWRVGRGSSNSAKAFELSKMCQRTRPAAWMDFIEDDFDHC